MNNDILKEKGIKSTKQRKKILEIINELDTDATIKNILAECRGIINKSTVYRIVELFIEKDIISTNINYYNQIYYQIKTSQEHEHYFTCVKCNKKFTLDSCPIKIIEENSDFKILNHTINISGICKDCQNLND